MAEQLGSPGSKFAHEELQQFGARKTYVSTKLAFEKVGGSQYEPRPKDYDFGDQLYMAMPGGFARGMGMETARVGLGGIRQAIGALADLIKEKAYTNPLRKKIFKDIVTNDTVVSSFENEQPGVAAQAYDTLTRFAPELSTDPHVATAFLRNAAMSGGPLDHNLIKGVADAEAAVHRARTEGAWYPGGRL